MKALLRMSEYYKQYFPNWDMLEKGLRLPVQHCAVFNQYFPENMLFQDYKRISLNSKLQVYFGNQIKSPYVASVNKILPYYLLDMASVLPVLCLHVEENQKVLDMCAAPGGKSFMILQLLGGSGQLVANDFTTKRYKRLKKVIKEYIPNFDSMKSNITLTQWDGLLFGKEERNAFDKILVDAPCSSERHVILKEFQYRGWNVKKMKENATVQKKLLLSAINALKPGGQVVYSTCSISPLENDAVVESVLKNCSQSNIKLYIEPTLNSISLFPPDTFDYLETSCGILIIPSQKCNWGPMYFSKITKI